MITELKLIANYLTTKREKPESKQHGVYRIYQDDKIRISFDTFYPNIDVHVFIDGVAHLAMSHLGHGYTSEYHCGAWELYVIEVLYPKAKVAAEASYRLKTTRKLRKRAPLNDWAVFS